MEKKNFISLIMGTVGGILFAIGMCMCLLPQWNAFNQGVVISVIGLSYCSSCCWCAASWKASRSSSS